MKLLFKNLNLFFQLEVKISKWSRIIYRFKLYNNFITIAENQNNFNIISNSSENTVIQKIIVNFFISR